MNFSVDVPGFKTAHVNRASGGRRDPGGKGINVATVTARYGIETAAAGFLGADNCGIFREHFERYSIRDEFIYIDGATREGIKITDPRNKITTDINFTGFEIDNEKKELFLAHFSKLCADHDYVILSGSLPCGVEPDFYAKLAGAAKAEGAFTAVDTSGEPLKLAVESGAVDLIKPNEHEIAEAFGSSGRLIASARCRNGCSVYGRKGKQAVHCEGCLAGIGPEGRTCFNRGSRR